MHVQKEQRNPSGRHGFVHIMAIHTIWNTYGGLCVKPVFVWPRKISLVCDSFQGAHKVFPSTEPHRRSGRNSFAPTALGWEVGGAARIHTHNGVVAASIALHTHTIYSFRMSDRLLSVLLRHHSVNATHTHNTLYNQTRPCVIYIF